jgi:hypothetical protein
LAPYWECIAPKFLLESWKSRLFWAQMALDSLRSFHFRAQKSCGFGSSFPKYRNADPCGSGSANICSVWVCGGGGGGMDITNQLTYKHSKWKQAAVIFTHLSVPAVRHRLILVVLQPKQKKSKLILTQKSNLLGTGTTSWYLIKLFC